MGKLKMNNQVGFQFKLKKGILEAKERQLPSMAL